MRATSASATWVVRPGAMMANRSLAPSIKAIRLSSVAVVNERPMSADCQPVEFVQNESPCPVLAVAVYLIALEAAKGFRGVTFSVNICGDPECT